MKNGIVRKIILFLIAILIVAGFYYAFLGGDGGQPENFSQKQLEDDPDISSEIDYASPETILDGSGQEEDASGTFENMPSASEEELNPDLTNPSEDQAPVIKNVLFSVPFTSQAPFGNWSDARKQDGCEEAAVIMAMAWVKGGTLDPESVDAEINKIAEYEEETVGTFHDTSAFDTAETIFKGYFDYDNVEVRYRIGKEDIIKELMAGNLVIVPTRGQLLGNPNYTPPGPVTHNLVIIGYDVKTKEFITNDPGTRKGKGYRYNEDVLEEAILDYPTGLHEDIEEEKTAMTVVRPMDR